MRATLVEFWLLSCSSRHGLISTMWKIIDFVTYTTGPVLCALFAVL
jgi:hypothetical protein